MKSHSLATTTLVPKRNALEAFLDDKLKQASAYRFPPMGLLDVLKIDPQNIHSQAPFVLHDMSSGLEGLITSDPRLLGNTKGA